MNKAPDHVIGGRRAPGCAFDEQSLRAIKLGGKIAVIGILSGFVKDLNVAAIFAANAIILIHGITVGSREHFREHDARY